jgi:flagellar hook-associated protein 3 FlgL
MLPTISTLSGNLALERLALRLRQDFEASGRELATGLKDDLAAALRGDTRPLAEADTTLGRLARQAENLTLAEGRLTVLQNALSRLASAAEGQGPSILSAAGRGDLASAMTHAGDAHGEFDSVITALNARSGGRSLFAGAAVDRAAIAPAETLLTALEALVAGAPDAETAIAAVDGWFTTPGGGFETTAYTGSTADGPEIELAPGESLAQPVRADDPAIRTLLRDLALAALADRGLFAGNAAEQLALLRAAGEGLVADGAGIALLRAGAGAAEERVAAAQSRQSAERTALEITRNAMVAADPYAAAAEFEALRYQMQSHYTVTARVTQMSLTSFLR